MAHSPETRAAAYFKVRQRREKWFRENGPCRNGDCGSWERLELHHRDPVTKVDHRVWSWGAEKREVELAKCEAWCHRCHHDHHDEERRRHGALARYQAGCRCELCKAARATAQAREQRPRRRRLLKIIELLKLRIAQLQYGE